MSPEDNKNLLSKIVGTVRASSALAAQDIDFFVNLDKDISSSVKELSDEILEMINSLILSIDEHFEPLEEGKEQLESSWKDFTNLIDNLFEKSDRSIDIINNNKTAQSNSGLQYLDDVSGGDSFNSKRITKPQIKFTQPVDNNESHPFKPLLTSKPHNLKPLEECFELVPGTEDIPEHYAQPYEFEIKNQEYNNKILQVDEPIPSNPWESTEATWVDTSDKLKGLLEDLKKFTEIAIDLEHHDYRTYYGIVCLMQISTREQDYIIDTIALRDELQVLNEVFTNPLITKVFHGAFMDIIWLQRDLGLYIVSLFDTFHASRAVGLPKHSLAYLLEKFANFKTSKKYQLADWRVRPLRKAMTAYARADTHFLLNIYDQLKNQLIQENKLASVLRESRTVAMRRFEYSKYRPKIASNTIYSPIEKSNPWKSLMFQYNVPTEKELLIKELYEWRDMMARRDDESPRYVMPNQLLISLVAYMPTDPNSVVSVANFVTDTVRSNAKVLANLIKNCDKQMRENNGKIVQDISSKDNKIGDSIPTLSQIGIMASQFGRFIAESNQNVGSDQSKMESSSFFGDLSKKANIISYEKGIKHVIPKQDLQKRSMIFENHMKDFDEVEYSIPKIVENEETTTKTSKEVDNVQINAENRDVSFSKVKDDSDEIVVLRKVNRDNNSKKAELQDKDNTEEDIIDYSKEDKVLINTRREKKKKRTFDPFSVENEGPQGVKKRRRGTHGKNISFKR